MNFCILILFSVQFYSVIHYYDTVIICFDTQIVLDLVIVNNFKMASLHLCDMLPSFFEQVLNFYHKVVQVQLVLSML